ncbi:hypothetical protein [Paraburkholderia antibiotica]|uniref:Uncharacterized protein n=1 Tax=Paraburkholderia antibiotica TaxID=2728839 RepID=A0A7Y0A1S6_9BURK|nr:hypothetical protein [Paraburkholderia antibiotica]NML34928.1 hypothetical protein [Paraburkholderia antibiotica]
MINLGVLLVGFILGVFALGLLLFLVVLHKPRVSAPTLRRKRDKPVLERDLLVELFDELNRKRPSSEPMYMYGVTGEER